MAGEVACICHPMPSYGILTQTNDQVACGAGECAVVSICVFNASRPKCLQCELTAVP